MLIHMKHPRHALLLSLFALAGACLFTATHLSAADKLNVVLIYIDDLGYGDIGCYDCKDIPTPHVDRLAKEGVRFTASYITNRQKPVSPWQASAGCGHENSNPVLPMP